MPADPKPAARVRDRQPSRTLRLRGLPCVSCGRPATNAAHLIARGQSGDDVTDNLIPLCGEGNAGGCHGAEHGTPYVDRAGKRWTPDEVRARIGHWLATRRGMPHVMYVLDRAGTEPGLDLLYRRFGLVLPNGGHLVFPDAGTYEVRGTIEGPSYAVRTGP